MASDPQNEIETAELRVRELLIEADTLELEFDRLGTAECIQKAVERRTQALSLTPDGHTDKPGRLNNLGITCLRLFKHLGELEDVDKAIDCLSQAALLTPDSHADKLRLLNNLGNAYIGRFKRLGKLADVNNAIECQIRAVVQAPDRHADKPSLFNSLGNSYGYRFERFGELADMDKSIEWLTQAVGLTPDDHAGKPGQLNNLGSSWLSRFNRFGELDDLNKAIHCLSQAVLLSPDGSAGKPSRLTNLGASFLKRFQHLGELADLDNAIENQAQAAQLTSESHPGRPTLLNNLGRSYAARFGHLGEVVDLDKAIECHTQAVLLTPDGHAQKPALLSNLGLSWLERFEHFGELADGNKAIEVLTEARLLTPDDHINKPSRLSNLGNSYLGRFERLGELSDLDEAILCLTQAVLLTAEGDTKRPSWLSNLGGAYIRRFERLGEPEDVEKAIKYQTESVLLTPDGHVDKPSLLTNLGMAYRSRFEDLGELADVDKAIEVQTQAVLLTPDGHPGKSRRLNHAGNSYATRFEHLGELVDVENAIQYHTRALLLITEGDGSRSRMLDDLGNSYEARFERFGELLYLDEAIKCQNQAVLLTPDGHVQKPSRLNNLGRSYISRFERLGELADLQCARSSFQRAAQHVSTSPHIQIWSARRWAESSLLLGDSPRPAYERCMELIPQLIGLGTTIDQRYRLLTRISNLATQAAAWAISDQSYEMAIEWLEEGRSIVWNQILQLRTPFDDLFAAHPQLAHCLKEIATKLEAAGARKVATASLTDISLDLEKDAQNHRRLATEWEQRLEEARSIPGFQNFMRPPKAAELKLAAADGPVILINADSTRCDALIILPNRNDIVHVPLEGLSLDKLANASVQLGSLVGHRGNTARGLKLSQSTPKPKDKKFEAVLATLWSDIVNPILKSDALTSLREMSGDGLPHVTWCTTGLLSFLPLHAAGCYDDSLPKTFDLVISSYTPTLGALLAPSAPASNQNPGVIAVGQEHTPGLSSLPNTVQELAAVEEHTGTIRFQKLDGVDATVSAVLGAMGEYDWVHLACHASQNPTKPAHSAFHLCDGPLTLEAITKKDFRNKGLAFLSACQTATGDDKLPDELVHLAAGMLMAGYPSVIATMWSIYDEDAPEVAGRVYAELLKDGKVDCRGSARALHKAVAGLREKVGHHAFMRWVPFIHIGV